jgi:RNA polymerase sigma factor (sigma-70 family)
VERQTAGGDSDGVFPCGRWSDLAADAARLARSWAQRFVDDPAGVDDVVQETIIAVLDRIGELRHPEAFVTWVRLITRSQAARHRRARRPESVTALGELLDLVDPADGPERSAERRLDVAVVRRALGVSSNQDRLLLELRYWGEWTDAELGGCWESAPGPSASACMTPEPAYGASCLPNPTSSRPQPPEPSRSPL